MIQRRRKRERRKRDNSKGSNNKKCSLRVKDLKRMKMLLLWISMKSLRCT